MKPQDSFFLNTSALTLSVGIVPWDSAVFGFAVAKIDDLRVADAIRAANDFRTVWDWLYRRAVFMVSCRLPHDYFAESFLLENQGFHFVEMVLHPQVSNLGRLELDNAGLAVLPATSADLQELTTIAGSAFGNERFHVDPRVDSEKANIRYANWVRNCMTHPAQTLIKVMHDEEIVALFVFEILASGMAYWHLTAVAPKLQGCGYGKRAWRAMMHYHQRQGVDVVCTTISARNTKVLNLYAHLGFQFLPPETTFHFVRKH